MLSIILLFGCIISHMRIRLIIAIVTLKSLIECLILNTKSANSIEIGREKLLKKQDTLKILLIQCRKVCALLKASVSEGVHRTIRYYSANGKDLVQIDKNSFEEIRERRSEERLNQLLNSISIQQMKITVNTGMLSFLTKYLTLLIMEQLRFQWTYTQFVIERSTRTILGCLHI